MTSFLGAVKVYVHDTFKPISFLYPVISQVATLPCPIKCQKILDSSIGTCSTTAESLMIMSITRVVYISLHSEFFSLIVLPLMSSNNTVYRMFRKWYCHLRSSHLLQLASVHAYKLPRPQLIYSIPVKHMFAVNCSYAYWLKLYVPTSVYGTCLHH